MKIFQEYLHTGRETGKERRGYHSDNIKGRFIILCGNIPFWDLVMGVVGPIVMGLWGESEAWTSQTQRWWTDTPWNKKKGREDL